MNTGMESDIFWSEIVSGFVEPDGTPSPRIHRNTPPEVIYNLNPSCDNHIYAVPNLFCCDKEYEVILKLFTMSTVCGISAAPPYITFDALLGGVRKCVRIKF